MVIVLIFASALLYTGYQRYLDEIDNYPVEVALTNIEADKDFVILSHNLEFIGICPQCKDSLKNL